MALALAMAMVMAMAMAMALAVALAMAVAMAMAMAMALALAMVMAMAVAMAMAGAMAMAMAMALAVAMAMALAEIDMTDNITVSRELLRQVLDAACSPYCAQDLGKLVPTLRAALEQTAPMQEPETDVRKIMLAVVPGFDGMGAEVYAKSTKDVEDKLSALGSELEEWQLGIRRLPAPVQEQQPAHLPGCVTAAFSPGPQNAGAFFIPTQGERLAVRRAQRVRTSAELGAIERIEEN